MLDWLEYILGLVTTAGETGEELPQSLIPHSFALPLRQGEEEHAAAETADIPPDPPEAIDGGRIQFIFTEKHQTDHQLL